MAQSLQYFSSSSDSEFHDENSEDLSHSELDVLPNYLTHDPQTWKSIQLSFNNFTVFPEELGTFVNLVNIDLSNNGLTYISDSLLNLSALQNFTARNNLLDGLPKDFGTMRTLETVNFSGNKFKEFPMQLTELENLKTLHFGANQITYLPNAIGNMRSLEILYLGGNSLTEVPATVGSLNHLTALVLCDNQLNSIPPTFVNLRKLQSLSLHNNKIATLPPEIVSLNLVELSLRNNPLVARFVQDLFFKPPSLLELSGRVIKIERVPYSEKDLPSRLICYLNSAQQCVNPMCKGVFFDSKVEQVKFVDFCGKYRLPLLQYLCSPVCSYKPAYAESDTDSEHSAKSKLKKVLLG
ncbi:leucine-rich repeat-containing protein 58-like [Dreissena polymorpha]|uniref:Leucine-rich repeat-containing protein 58 n=1 Tax=Dreissena polymorpha TaxID=45954 RepID=A0A9D4BQ91_DREPO|nr:leucine-rich repeat-containing protein 58-like [Dreissena polymorpha]KAH3703126.1 hypothetical protein DPMN_078155 [Dreissena polymorpha]